MVGGAGNDHYHVDDAGDDVVEVGGQGDDHVFSTVDYQLTDGVENLNLYSNAITGSGNALANDILGNAKDNELNGFAGNDSLRGLGGDDTMAGGAGNDIYMVEDAGDDVQELLNEGKDTVQLGAMSSAMPWQAMSRTWCCWPRDDGQRQYPRQSHHRQ